ncbi:MAG: DNA internalization-related competence protein ComEC/Rec2 [Pasteurellaceae bacterium]|nr:DNA internalization-related competence protein ComEC/Rec2 [Pasteurellaceae bacterium]
MGYFRWNENIVNCPLNIDKLALIFVLSSLTLLVVPDFLLISWQIGGALSLFFIFCWWCCNRYRNIVVLLYIALSLMSLSYVDYCALSLLQQTKQIAQLANPVETELTVEQVLHQQDYQTLIGKAKLQSGSDEQRIYVNWQNQIPVHSGEKWHVKMQVKPLNGRLNLGGFDRQQWCLSQGISAVGKVKTAVENPAKFSWRERRLANALQQTEGLTQQGLLLALGFGERAWLPKTQWQIYQRTNTAHLIAISGLHIGLAMLLGFYCTRVLQFVLPTRFILPELPLGIGLLCAYGYAELAGFAVSTMRALLGLLLVYFFHFRRAYCSPWRAFLRVIGLLLFIDPLMLLSTSFWLSISAVACLLLWYQFVPFYTIEFKGKTIALRWRWLARLLHLQLGLFWLFTPVMLLIFNSFSLNSFIANLFAVPLFSFILVPLVLLAVVTQFTTLWRITDNLSQYFTDFIQLFEQGYLIFSQKNAVFFTAVFWGSFLIFIIWLYRWRKANLTQSKPRLFSIQPNPIIRAIHLNRLFVTGVVAITVLLGYGVNSLLFQAKWRVEMLDIGQGSSVLLVKNGQAILYDTGASWRGGSMAELEILPYLQREGIELDQIILSHDDNDHSGGVDFLLRTYPKAEFISSSFKKYANRQADRFCQQGMQWQWQGLYFTVLAPTELSQRADNTHSCVLWVSDQQYNVLLTGDADQASEYRFVPLLDGKYMDILQVGHHGSKTSTSELLLQQLQPKIALISAGRFNPWHFPHQQVLTRLQQHKIAVKQTAVLGEISVQFYVDKIKLVSSRERFSPWYRQRIE